MVKRLLQTSVAFVGLITPLLLGAQETPKAEVFGGYSLLRVGGLNLNGWDGAVTVNLTSWFGIAADVSGHYFSRTVFVGPPFPLTPAGTADSRFHSFTFGPQFSYRKSRYTLFTHGLFGVTHFSSSVQVISPPGFSFSGSANAFTTLLGGGMDISVAHRIAVRPVEAEYLLFRNNGVNANEFRYSTGVEFRFGER